MILDTGNPRYLDFYKRQGYEEIGEVAVGPIREHVFFHANPQVFTNRNSLEVELSVHARLYHAPTARDSIRAYEVSRKNYQRRADADYQLRGAGAK